MITMKRTILLLSILLILLSFGACSKTQEEFVLTQITVDNIPISDVSGYLKLFSDNSGELSLNGNVCKVYWEENPFAIRINDIVASSEHTQSGINLFLDEKNVVLSFSIGPAVEVPHSSSSQSADNLSGRFYFSNCEGEWADYDGRSMSVTGTKNDEKIVLFNQYFSKDTPMVEITIKDSHCLEGYIMAYPLKEYDVKIDADSQLKSEVNKTEFLHPEEYIWNKYIEKEDTDINTGQMIDVLTLSGNVRNSNGGFTYKIVLTPEQ